MGKKRHSQDKMWLTYKELMDSWGGKKDSVGGSNIKESMRLPFNYCSLSFCPWENPVCLEDGTIFDILNILPYIRKYKKNPINGKPLLPSSLIKLNFHKNQDGNFHCPITYKAFTDSTQMVAIRETGNVFSLDAYKSLNEKLDNYVDLLDNTEFDKDKIIRLNNSRGIQEISRYEFVKNQQNLDFIKESREDAESSINLSSNFKKLLEEYEIEMSNEDNEEVKKLKKIMTSINSSCNKTIKNEVLLNEEIKGIVEIEEQDYRKVRDLIKKRLESALIGNNSLINLIEVLNVGSKLSLDDAVKTAISSLNLDETSGLCSKLEFSSFLMFHLDLDSKYSNSEFSDGRTSQSTTSTTFNASYDNSINKGKLMLHQRRKRFYRMVIEKGYASICTSMGKLNIELFCKETPMACENFLELSKKGFYDNTKFHRLIKGFVLQGGDPTGTGMGGSSIFGKKFDDEFASSLKHNKRGILSMANSGPNTNSSQFFVLFGDQPHLNGKHTVFGEVVGNLKLLDSIEKVPTNQESIPLTDIRIVNVNVVKNPFRQTVSKIILEYLMKEVVLSLHIKLASSNSKGIIKPNSDPNTANEIGKYLSRKRILESVSQDKTEVISKDIDELNNNYIYEGIKPKKKAGEFDFSNW